MDNNFSKDVILFLLDDIGLKPSSLELGLKLSERTNTPFPILMWSYGILTLEELDKLYSFLYQNPL